MEFIKEHREKFIGGTILVFLLIISVIYFFKESKQDYIYHGVRVDNIDISGMTKKEAARHIAKEKGKEEPKIIFLEKKDSSGESPEENKEYIIPFQDLGYSMDIDQSLREAYQFGRQGNRIRQYWDISTARIYHRNFKIKDHFDDKKIDHVIRYLADQVYIPPKDAYITVNQDNEMVLYPEEIGQYLDLTETKEMLKDNIVPEKVFELPIYTKEAEIKSAYFDGIDKLIGEYTTDFSSSEKNRKSNIAIGAKFFNNILLKPGDILSFNKTVGEISEANGFKNAGVILNGEFDRGLGGGICQVSTTMYNAVIRADLEVVERYNHSRPIAYVPLGTDAAVVMDYKDLRFKNNTNHPIYIKTETDDREVTFKIFGNSKDRDYEVNIDPKLLGVVQPKVRTKYTTSMMKGEQKVEKSGAKGYSYRTYKEIIKDGEVKKVEELSTSYYVPQDRIVIIGEGQPKSSDDQDDNSKKTGNKNSSNRSNSNDS
ncbi:MAG: VanW family protein [Tissierellia bacterium]|nr:VanW family protein [Tissierellia bacterium]